MSLIALKMVDSLMRNMDVLWKKIDDLKCKVDKNYKGR